MWCRCRGRRNRFDQGFEVRLNLVFDVHQIAVVNFGFDCIDDGFVSCGPQHLRIVHWPSYFCTISFRCPDDIALLTTGTIRKQSSWKTIIPCNIVNSNDNFLSTAFMWYFLIIPWKHTKYRDLTAIILRRLLTQIQNRRAELPVNSYFFEFFKLQD